MRSYLVAAAACALAVSGAASAARAQTSSAAETSASGPAPTTLLGEPTSLDGLRASSPLRLSLEAAVPALAGQFPQCQGLEDEAGNSVGGIPVQHYAEVTLVPHLVLSGFSQLGCPIDAGVGGALTWSMPLRRDAWLVLGAGAYANPARLPLFGGFVNAVNARLLDRPVNAAVRADYVWQTPSGRLFNLGVQSTGAVRQMVTFGSAF